MKAWACHIIRLIAIFLIHKLFKLIDWTEDRFYKDFK
jgi:hypothetical protein